MTLRSCIAAFSTGTSSAMRPLAMTKPPGCCERWRGNDDQLRRELHPELHDRRLGIEAALAQPLGRDAAAVEPVLALRDRLDALQVDAERAAGVAQRRARPVADDDGGERGAVAAVLAVDVLDHLLAALVLEVDVDVGRLVALDADEAAEQQRGAARIDLGDEEAVADQRVGGAAAALAEDALRARPGDDVGDGEEVGLVLELGDDRELALDRLPMRLGQAVAESASARLRRRAFAATTPASRPAGTISCGYSYFSSSSEKLQRPARTIVFSSHSGW